MIQRNSVLTLLLASTLLVSLVTGTASSEPGSVSPGPSSVSSPAPAESPLRITPVAGSRSGPLHITSGGMEKQIAEDAVKAWLLQAGRQVAYSGLDGSGGYENEGQSLWIWDAGSGAAKKVLSGYYLVQNVTEATSARQEPALIVELEDGMLGARHLSVVDPARGEVFFLKWASLDAVREGQLHVNVYREADWEAAFDNPEARVEPHGKAVHDLHQVLKGSVIENPSLR